MQVKKLTSDECINCKESKEDNYASFCNRCDMMQRGIRSCVECGQTIGAQHTRCEACTREHSLRVAIAALEKRVQDLEAREAEGVRLREQDWNATAAQQLLE